MTVPKPSRALIKTSFIYFLTGGFIGTLILWAKADVRFTWAWKLFPVHLDLMLFGWILQFVFGVAYWILPRFIQKPVRGPEKPVWIGYYLLNLGLALILIAPLFLPRINLLLPGRLLLLSSTLTLSAVILPRVKPFVLPPEAVAKMAELRKRKAQEAAKTPKSS